jgi:RNA polymerase sigma-70 factor (ECF subfamily)
MIANVDRFESRSKFSTWVFQVARNAGLDAIKARSRRQRTASTIGVGPPAADPTAQAELRAALANLSSKLREALLLVEVVGLSYREAGAALGVAEGTVKSRVFAAREQMTVWLHAGALDDV